MKTRFCPSPTGYLHLGNVRTALFSALAALHAKGIFLLRIEDTDKTRSDEIFTQALMEDLTWLNLCWQEGPFYQSKRQNIYDDFYQKLLVIKRAYPCFCTEEQLTLQRTLQQKAGKPPRYNGTCRRLSENEITEKKNTGAKFTLRFAMPENEVIMFQDTVRGEQRFQSNDLGDFVIQRSDGTAPFMYSSVIDDALMGVTEVLRGEDHLTNTPRQIAILQALNLPIPSYGHIALIVGNDNSPLSKRHGSRSVRVLREEGFLPMAIVNYLARLGHYYGHDRFLTLESLAAEFKRESLVKSPAKYNEQQLLFWQTQALLRLSDVEFWNWTDAATRHLVPDAQKKAFVQAIKPNVQFPKDVRLWAESLFGELPEFDAEKQAIIQAAGKNYFMESLIALENFGAEAEKMTHHLKEKCNVKGKALFMPLRIALTGEQHGPDLAAIFSLMSVQTMKRRLERGAF